MWRKDIPLGNVLNALKDGTHGTHERVKRGVPFLSAKNITKEGTVTWSDEDSFITESEYNLIHSTFKLEPNDILLTIVGTIGRRAIYNGEKVTFQRSVAYLRPKQNLVDPRYLFQLFGSKKFTYLLLDRANTTAQPGLYLGQLAEIEIDYPESLTEQKAIAEVLDTVDEAIAATQAMLDKQDKIKDGLLQDLLTRGVDANGKLRPAYKDAPDLYKQSPLGFIPKEWATKKAQDFCYAVTDGTHDSPKPTDTGYPLITSKNLKGGKLDWSNISYVSEADYKAIIKRSVVEVDDILFGMIGTIGEPAIVDEGENEIAPKNVGIFRMKGDKIKSSYLFYYLNSSHIHAQIRDALAGSTQNFVGLGIIRDFIIADIPNPEMLEVVKRLQSLRLQEQENKTDLSKLKKLKAGLMQDLLTGKKRISKNQREAA